MTPRENYLRQAEYCRTMAEQAGSDEVRERYLTAREEWLKLARSEDTRWATGMRDAGLGPSPPEAV